MHKDLIRLLDDFRKVNKIATSGRLSMILTLTRRATLAGLPLNLNSLRTEGGGQVSGAGGEAVRKILLDHGIERKLSAEGGRTSRGSIQYAEDYVKLLNKAHANGVFGSVENQGALNEVEVYWIKAVQSFFDAQRIKISLDTSRSIGEIVSLVLAEAKERQRRLSGMAIEGTVLQHLIGAKLALALGDEAIAHHGTSTGDVQSGRQGDFIIGETAIHVTAAPTEALLRKCQANLDKALRPIVVCPRETAQAAVQLARVLGISERLEVYDAQAFISVNLNEKAEFKTVLLRQTTQSFIKKYNELIAQWETDQSLQLEEK